MSRARACARVAPITGNAGVNPLLHFLQFGIAEGRSAFGDGVLD